MILFRRHLEGLATGVVMGEKVTFNPMHSPFGNLFGILVVCCLLSIALKTYNNIDIRVYVSIKYIIHVKNRRKNNH